MGTKVKKFPEIALTKIHELLKPVEKTNFKQLKDILNTIRGTNSVWKDNSETIINWSDML